MDELDYVKGLLAEDGKSYHVTCGYPCYDAMDMNATEFTLSATIRAMNNLWFAKDKGT